MIIVPLLLLSQLQELEMENAKLRDDLAKLRESVELNDGENKSRDELFRQFHNMQEELSRKREESIQLRTVLASPNKPNASPSQNGENDDDIGMVLQTQKQVRNKVFCFTFDWVSSILYRNRVF